MSTASIAPDELSSLSNPPPVMGGSSSSSTRSGRSNYLGVLAPLVGALVVLTMATLSFKSPNQVSEWAADTFFPHGSWFTNMIHGRRLSRRLYHPQEPAKYFACTDMMATSDENYDNSLTIDEYKSFTNLYAGHHYSQTVGSNLPKELRAVFNKFSKETEGSSNKIIDIYGSRNGERDGITAHQMELLEDLCNESMKTLDELFENEQEQLTGASTKTGESDAAVKSEVATTRCARCSKLNINASFTMTIPEGMTVEELNESLQNGKDPGHLRHAFHKFVEHVVLEIDGEVVDDDKDEDGSEHLDLEAGGANTTDGNATRRTTESDIGSSDFVGIRGRGLIPFGAGEGDERQGQRKRARRRLNVQLEEDSDEIYKYVESPCPGQEEASILDDITDTLEDVQEKLDDLNPFGSGGNSTDDNSTSTNSADDERREFTDDEGEKVCVTAMGKYKVDVDEDEEADETLTSIYQRASKITKQAIDNGEMEMELEKEPDGTMFHVEGHGTVEDHDFDPYEDIEEEETKKKGLRTLDIVLIAVGSALIFCLCCVLCFVELERKTRPRQNSTRGK